MSPAKRSVWILLSLLLVFVGLVAGAGTWTTGGWTSRAIGVVDGPAVPVLGDPAARVLGGPAVPFLGGSTSSRGNQTVWESPQGLLWHDAKTGVTEVIPDSRGAQGYRMAAGQVVFAASDENDLEIYLYSSSTGTTVRLTNNDVEDDRPDVGSRFVTWSGWDGHDEEVFVHDLASGRTLQLTDNESDDAWPNVDGNRIVYVTISPENRARGGPYRVMLAEPPSEPDISVPQRVLFGVVEPGDNTSNMVTISNVGGTDLTVSALELQSGGAGFCLVAPPATPFSVAPGATVDVNVSFGPSVLGCFDGALLITSDDPDQPVVQVTWAGSGEIEDPDIRMDGLFAFCCNCLTIGSLQGDGPGGSAADRANALRNMLEAAGDYIATGRRAEAIAQLEAVRTRCDGTAQGGQDFVTGTARQELAQRVLALKRSLELQQGSAG